MYVHIQYMPIQAVDSLSIQLELIVAYRNMSQAALTVLTASIDNNYIIKSSGQLRQPQLFVS